MRICFLEGDMSRSGGTERMTAMLSSALVERHEVYVISHHMEKDELGFELDERVKHITPAELSGDGILSKIRKIRRFIKDNEIDIVINVDIGMGIYGVPAVRGTRARVITWEHANFYNNWNSRAFPYIRKYAAKKSDALVVLTERDRKNYTENIKGCAKIEVIHNPSKHHAFKYDLESKKILSAGLLLPIKGYDRAVEVASRVLPKHDGWQWVICGEGQERAHLEALIKEKNLEGRFVLAGNVKNMDEQYESAALFVLTSDSEGLPMVLLEAKSFGLPILSFDITTGPDEIVDDGVNGFLVEPYDIEKMSEKLELMISSAELREKMSEKSTLRAEEFDWDRIIDKWEELIGELKR